MRVVVALGGNALLRHGQPMTVENQRANVRTACDRLAPIAMQHELVISRGNGPQIGLLALEEAAYEEVPDAPLDVLGAETQGTIGAEKLAADRGWVFKPDGDSLRRVVPSPAPKRFFEHSPITWLLGQGCVVICAGGGGDPDRISGRAATYGRRSRDRQGPRERPARP